MESSDDDHTFLETSNHVTDFKKMLQMELKKTNIYILNFFIKSSARTFLKNRSKLKPNCVLASVRAAQQSPVLSVIIYVWTILNKTIILCLQFGSYQSFSVSN
jgi:hypothetical protein